MEESKDYYRGYCLGMCQGIKLISESLSQINRKDSSSHSLLPLSVGKELTEEEVSTLAHAIAIKIMNTPMTFSVKEDLEEDFPKVDLKKEQK